MHITLVILNILLIKTCLALRLEDFGVNTSKIIYDGFVPRVVNGRPANLGDVPYQIAFKQLVSRRKRIYATFCGGTLVSPNKLISAAHCFEESGIKCFNKGEVGQRTLEMTMAVAGNLNNRARYKSQDSTTDGQWRKLKSMYIPAGYKFPKNDISVGFTKRSFSFNANVAPIPYTTIFKNYKGRCLVSGYGKISMKMDSEVLLMAHLDVIPTKLCNRKHRMNMVKFVCTDMYLTDVGKGDSGGPLVCSGTDDPLEGTKGILVGVVSGNRLRVGSFFTRVSSYTEFLNSAEHIFNGPNKALICMCLIYGNTVLSLYCFILF